MTLNCVSNTIITAQSLTLAKWAVTLFSLCMFTELKVHFLTIITVCLPIIEYF
jgi:hypothetical protein